MAAAAMEGADVVARLSSETQLHHAEVDADLERLLEVPTAHTYRLWLVRQHGFLAPFEAALDASAAIAATVDAHTRRKAPRLRSDLLALGVSGAAITGAPRCAAVPERFARVPVALGWLFVVERATLQHGSAFRQLARVLPGEVAFASSVLKCYDGNVGVMWRAFAALVDEACREPEQIAALVGAAKDAFRRLRRWQHDSAAGLPSERHRRGA